MKIQVTQEDIDNGTPDCDESCPIALALQRDFPDSNPSVRSSGIYMYENHEDVSCRRELNREFYIPRKALRFIVDFDGGFPMDPIEIELTERMHED